MEILGQQSNSARCIYCLQEKTREFFNREHVIPEAFGNFRGNIVVLHETVCSDCNKHFGEEHDRIISRGSLEGALRLFRGLTKPTRSPRLLGKRVRMHLPRPPEWEGVIIFLSASADGSRVVTTIPPQAGFRMSGSDSWEFRTLDEIEKEGIPPGCLDMKGCSVRLAYASDEDGKRLREVLARLNVSFSGEHRFPAPARAGEEIELVVWGTYDILSARAIAKMAFNYLAVRMGGAFVLDPAFDPVRRFVRDGVQPEFTVVRPNAHHILEDETTHIGFTDGHIVTLNWDATRRHIFAQVGLFNTMFYTVLLAPPRPAR